MSWGGRRSKPRAGEKPRDPPSAINTAIRLLSHREHSQHELRKKLIEREITPEAADAAIERLVQEDLQSDKRFVRSTISMRANGGHGPMRIRADLGQHALEEGAVQEAMEAAGVDWLNNARQILKRRYGEGELDFKTRNKAISFLMRRGFSLDIAREAMGSRSEEPEPDQDEVFD